jgi:hypothetical protein
MRFEINDKSTDISPFLKGGLRGFCSGVFEYLSIRVYDKHFSPFLKEGLKGFLLFLFLLSLLPLNLFSQGFDWQYSARLPEKSPIGFIGLSGDIGFTRNTGGISLIEIYSPCCKFESGTGTQYSVGLKGEYWYTSDIAIDVGLRYSRANSSFKSQTESPFSTFILKTEFDFESSISNIQIDFGAKTRINESHFNVGASISFSYLIGNNFTFKESVISPSDFYFSTNPPSQSRDIPLGSVGTLHNFNISPSINISYDLSLGLGIYATPSLNASYSLTSVVKDESWRHLELSFGISIFRGIIFSN